MDSFKTIAADVVAYGALVAPGAWVALCGIWFARRQSKKRDTLRLVTLRVMGESCQSCLWLDRYATDIYMCGLHKVCGDVLRIKIITPDDICKHHTVREL